MVFQLTSLPLTLDDPYKGQIKYNWVFNGLYLLNGTCYDQILHETHIGSPMHVYVFQLTSWSLNWMTFDLGWPLMVNLGTMEVILSHIWINFTFDKLFTWTGTNNDNIWLTSATQAILSNVRTNFDFWQNIFLVNFWQNWHI